MKAITVKIRDMDKVIFQGEADRISSFNEVGPFDVYPMHANFISILKKEITLYNKNVKLKQIKIEQAVLKVKHDIANIFLGIEALYVDENGETNNPDEIRNKESYKNTKATQANK